MSYGTFNLLQHARTAALAAVVAACLPALASAQDAPAAAPAAPAAQATTDTPPDSPSAWIKVCDQVQSAQQVLCVTTQELRAETGQPIASFSLQSTPDPKKYVAGIVVPIGFVIPPGVTINVDGEKKAQAAFIICIPASGQQPPVCLAQAPVADDFIASMKKGSKLDMVLVSGQNKQIPISLTLVGFSKAYDGPGFNKAAAEKRRRDDDKVVQQKALEQRQKIEAAQRAKAGTAAPAQ